MLIQFLYSNGSNPYITKTHEELFKMLRKYYYKQTSENIFFIVSPREWNGTSEYNYQNNKLLASAIARDWQQVFKRMNYSIDELVKWQGFFEEIGKKIRIDKRI